MCSGGVGNARPTWDRIVSRLEVASALPEDRPPIEVCWLEVTVERVSQNLCDPDHWKIVVSGFSYINHRVRRYFCM
jgi:hypothetical protein